MIFFTCLLRNFNNPIFNHMTSAKVFDIHIYFNKLKVRGIYEGANKTIKFVLTDHFQVVLKSETSLPTIASVLGLTCSRKRKWKVLGCLTVDGVLQSQHLNTLELHSFYKSISGIWKSALICYVYRYFSKKTLFKEIRNSCGTICKILYPDFIQWKEAAASRIHFLFTKSIY